MSKANCYIVSVNTDMWLVPTSDIGEAQETALDYHPRACPITPGGRIASGVYTYTPIVHPHPETIERYCGS